MKQLKGQEIFAAGLWNNMTFQQHDLDAMVAAFDELKSVHKPPLKIGHNETQPLKGDQQHALGWISKIYVQGKKLLADFEDVPDIVAKAIESKLYRRVSIELSIDVRYKGKLFPFVVDAVALLGADLPAVNTLNDLGAYMARGGAFPAGRHASFSAVAGNLREENAMDPNVQAAIDGAVTTAVKKVEDSLRATFATERTALETENKGLKDKLATFEREKTEAAAAAKKKEVGDKRKRIGEIFEALIKAEVIKPAQREAQEGLLGVNDDERVLAIDEAKLVASFNVEKTTNSDGKIGFKAIGAGDRSHPESMTFAQAESEIDRKVAELRGTAEGGKLSYSAAKQRVLEADPKLADVYAAGPKKEG